MTSRRRFVSSAPGWTLALCALVSMAAGLPCRAAALPTEPVLRAETGGPTAPITSLATDEGGHLLVIASEDKSLRFFDLDRGAPRLVVHPPLGAGTEGIVRAVAVSPDAALVAACGETSVGESTFSVFLLDVGSGRLVRRVAGLPGPCSQVRFSPDGRRLAIGMRGSNGVRLVDTASGATVAEDAQYRGTVRGLAFDTHGHLAASSEDKGLRLYRVDSGGLHLVRRLDILVYPGELAFSPDGATLAVGDNGCHLLKTDDLDANRPYVPQFGLPCGTYPHLAWAPDAHALYVVTAGDLPENGIEGGDALEVALGAGPPVRTVLRHEPTGQWGQVRALPDGGVVFSIGSRLWRRDATHRIVPLMAAGTVVDFKQSNAFTVSDDGSMLRFLADDASPSPMGFDVRQRLDGPVTFKRAPRRDSRLQLYSGPHPTLNGRDLKRDGVEVTRAHDVAPDDRHVVFAFDHHVRCFDAEGNVEWERTESVEPARLVVSSDGRWVVVGYRDGVVRWLRLADGVEELALLMNPDGQRWVLWTPAGYFDASPGGEALVGWHVNRGPDQMADFFPLAKFRTRFRRPALVDAVLGPAAAVTVAMSTRIQAPTSAPTPTKAAPAPAVVPVAASGAPALIESLAPPAVDLLSAGSVTTRTGEVVVQVKARSPRDALVTQWVVMVDGQVVPQARGIDRQHLQTGAVREFKVQVHAAQSDVQVVARNRYGASTPAVVRVRWLQAPPAASTQAARAALRPTLYLLAIGVSAYRNSAVTPLKFAAKDARDFAAAFKRQEGRLYGKVETRVLTDADATRDGIMDGLQWLSAQVTQQDVGVLFIAGHGDNDPMVHSYVFLPVDADPQASYRTLVPGAAIKSVADGHVGKWVYFIDTCHAGGVLGPAQRGGGNDMTDVVNDLIDAEGGLIVFSSSTGRQSSLEDPAWGNGAFTKAVVEGLDGKAALPGDPRITQATLQAYVAHAVKALTGGRQSPTMQTTVNLPEIPIAVK